MFGIDENLCCCLSVCLLQVLTVCQAVDSCQSKWGAFCVHFTFLTAQLFSKLSIFVQQLICSWSSQNICLRNNLLCVEWDVQPYLLTNFVQHVFKSWGSYFLAMIGHVSLPLPFPVIFLLQCWFISVRFVIPSVISHREHSVFGLFVHACICTKGLLARYRRTLTHTPLIGAIGINSTPDSGASFSCQYTTSNVVDWTEGSQWR